MTYAVLTQNWVQLQSRGTLAIGWSDWQRYHFSWKFASNAGESVSCFFLAVCLIYINFLPWLVEKQPSTTRNSNLVQAGNVSPVEAYTGYTSHWVCNHFIAYLQKRNLWLIHVVCGGLVIHAALRPGQNSNGNSVHPVHLCISWQLYK